MPNKIAIEVVNLSKRYPFRGTGGLQATNASSLRDKLELMIRKPLNAFAQKESGALHGSAARDVRIDGNCYWALRDLTFEVAHGEIVGIIGPNGAGKSTLLKILGRIISPSSGQAIIRGRCSSLFDVGLGFSGELSGRDNIRLAAALLGGHNSISPPVVNEIIEFSELEDFIDHPLKFYSTGMAMRLGLSIAVALPYRILLVDEALAVGDMFFQKKCLDRFRKLAQAGTTIVIVSHMLNSVARLATRFLTLREGKLQYDGSSISSALHAAYPSDGGTQPEEHLQAQIPRMGFLSQGSIRIHDSEGHTINGALDFDGRYWVDVTLTISEQTPTMVVGVLLRSTDGAPLLMSCHSDRHEEDLRPYPPGRWSFRMPIPPGILNSGAYSIEVLVSVAFGPELFPIQSGRPTIQFRVAPRGGGSSDWREERQALLSPQLEWVVCRLPE